MTQIIKRVVTTALIAGLMFIILPITAKAGTNDICGKDGCNRKKGSNGTVYCDYHAAEYARNKGYKVCAVSGCYAGAQSKGSYCSKHTCREKNCYSKSVTGNSGYCSTHDPSKKKTSSVSTVKKSTSKKKSSSQAKKYDTYHVYDYDSAQSFADDKYEEFYDYEDDYDDEDEAYDAAEDYWRDHH